MNVLNQQSPATKVWGTVDFLDFFCQQVYFWIVEVRTPSHLCGKPWWNPCRRYVVRFRRACTNIERSSSSNWISLFCCRLWRSIFDHGSRGSSISLWRVVMWSNSQSEMSLQRCKPFLGMVLEIDWLRAFEPLICNLSTYQMSHLFSSIFDDTRSQAKSRLVTTRPISSVSAWNFSKVFKGTAKAEGIDLPRLRSVIRQKQRQHLSAVESNPHDPWPWPFFSIFLFWNRFLRMICIIKSKKTILAVISFWLMHEIPHKPQ